MSWWGPKSPDRRFDAIICDGAVRSGKTLCMGLSFVCWATACFSGQQFAFCGKSVVSLRRNLVQELTPLLRELGFQVIPGEANYLLFSSSVPLLEPLRERGILLRSCGNYSGLDGSWYRTAVRTEAENQRLLTALQDIRKEGNR